MEHGTGPTIEEIALAVSDVERAVAWHERALGSTRDGDASTALGDTTFRFTPGAGGAAQANQVGAFHVCIAVPDVAAAYARLRELGVSPSTEPVEVLPGLWTVYFTDPDGIRYQFLEHPGASRVHHFAYSVSNLAGTLEWYARTFGVEAGYRGEAAGERVSSTLEVEPGAAYRVALVPLGEGHLELMEWAGGGEPAPGGWELVLRGAGLGPVELRDPDGMRLLVRD
jgi:catechol 2,3-dioxygenase-like lactoylglutathione lyase family enzyme